MTDHSPARALSLSKASSGVAPDHRSVLTTLLPGFVGTTLPGWLATRLADGLGGVCLFGENIESLPQLQELTEAILAANPRAIIALDEEGGDVTRLHARTGSPAPGNAVLGRIDDLATTRADGRWTGLELRQAGCTVNFAPSVDINSRADNPIIGVRSFGGEAEAVAAHGAAWIEGLQSTGVAAGAKHFPGHGDTATDSHFALPVIDRSLAELRERELVPFVAAIGAGVQVVMTSHILLPQLDPDQPATMSRTIVTGLLRDELGFTGVIVTDALDMAGASGLRGMPDAAVRSLAAGCDLLCLGTGNTDAEITAIVSAVDGAVAAGALDAEWVAGAAARVLALADDLAAAGTDGPEWDEDAVVWAGSNRKLIEAFDIEPAAQAWRAARPAGYTVVRLDSVPNTAAGLTPWGPFAAPDLAGQALVAVSPEDPALPEIPRSEPVMIIGRDIHRHAFARSAVDRLRARHDQVLVVDMGWPADDHAYADLATFGASPLLGHALLTYLNTGP